MRALLLISVLCLCACERVDYIEIIPADVEFKQPNNETWLESRCMARNGVRAVSARVTWSVKDPAIAKVNDKGQLTPVGDGETEVIARSQGVEARIPVRVIYADHLEVTPPTLTLKEGQDSVTPSVRVFRKNGQVLTDRSVTLTVLDKHVAQIVGKGAILPLDPGETKVEVQVDGAKTSLLVKVEKK